MQVILWGVFIFSVILEFIFLCIMKISKKINFYNRNVASLIAGLNWVILYIGLLDIYFLGIFKINFFISLIALTMLFGVFSTFYYEEEKKGSREIVLNKKDNIENIKKIEAFFKKYKLNTFFIPINTLISEIVVLFFEYQVLVIIFILKFKNILLKEDYIFHNLLFFVLLFFIEVRLIKVIIRYKDYSWLRQVLRYFMFISVVLLLVENAFSLNYINILKSIHYPQKELVDEERKTENSLESQQEEEKGIVVENNNLDKYIPTAEEARYINYKTYYNDDFDYFIDYPDDEYFKILKAYEDGIKLSNDNGEVIISLTSNRNPNGENLQQAYDKAIREKPNASYKFLGKTFFTITYEENGLLIFRKTMYDKNTDKYVYLYVSFPQEYKEYMSPIVERMANSMKKSSSIENNSNISDITYKNYSNSYCGYSIDYPISSDFYISTNTDEGMEIKSNDENVFISITCDRDIYRDNLQAAYNRAIREKPNAVYKFLGKTFFTITYEENGLLIFRKTVYDKNIDKYVYLYVSFPEEYKEYMSPIVERMANSMKKFQSTQNKKLLSNVIYKNYYNEYYGYSMDYPTSSDFYILTNTNEGMEIKSNDENVYISVAYDYDTYGDDLQAAYNRAVSENPDATYKFLGKTFFTITYEENGLLIFRKTVFDRVNNMYIYLYVSFPPEYKEYMSPIVEKMANTMKKR